MDSVMDMDMDMDMDMVSRSGKAGRDGRFLPPGVVRK